MASADEYAAWIVKNSDKRGTPEFSTVAKAYELAKSEQNTQEISSNITPLQKEETTLAGISGAVTRGLAIPAAGAAIGAMAGAPLAGVGAIPGAVAGAGAATLAQMVGDPIVSTINSMFGTKYTMPTEAMEDMLTRVGVASPRTEAERIVQATAAGAGLAGGAVAAGRAVQAAAGATAPVAREVGRIIASQPALQISSGAAGGASGQVAHEMGAGTGGEIAAALAGGMVPVGIAASMPAARIAAGKIAEKAKSIIPGSTPASANRANTNLGAAATPLELQRATEAEMAGLRLSEGEVKRSPELLAWEKEKAKTPEYQAPFLERQQENNRAAINKLNQVLDDTGAEAVDYSDTGVAVVDTLLKGLNDEKAKTNALYTSFRNSPEAQSVVNTNQITSFLNEQPKNVSGITGVTDTARQNAVALKIAQIDDAGNLIPNPNATLGQLEDFRQSVSAISAANPNDKRLASIIKRQIDEIGDPVGGSLTRAMRAQRRSQAQKYENRAVVSQLLLEKKGMSDAVTPIEDVFKKTILNARPSEITHLKRVLSTIKDNEGAQAWKELQGATVKHLIEQSEGVIGADNLPTISGAKLNKAIKSLDKNGKLDLVMGKEAAEQIRNLNQVLQYIQSTPPLTSINNSGTARTVMALMGESALNGSLFGVPLPVVQGIKMLRSEIKDRKIKDQINKALNFQVKQGE